MKAKAQRQQMQLIRELFIMKQGHKAEQDRLQARIDAIGKVLDNWPRDLEQTVKALRDAGVEID